MALSAQCQALANLAFPGPLPPTHSPLGVIEGFAPGSAEDFSTTGYGFTTSSDQNLTDCSGWSIKPMLILPLMTIGLIIILFNSDQGRGREWGGWGAWG